MRDSTAMNSRPEARHQASRQVPHPSLPARRALFLDVDGTLLRIALGPRAVIVPARTRLALQTAVAREAGAVALVSGRTVAELDSLFAPMRLPAIGVHGLEWRDAAGRPGAVQAAPGMLDAARQHLARLVAAYPARLELEDKGRALAVHFRLAPHMEPRVRALMQELASAAQPRLHLHAGKYYLELRTARDARRRAIEEFMQAAPFAGRMPVFVGDDDTDEQGFEAVNDMGGLSIHVGHRPGTAARWQFANVNAVLHWLMAPEQMGGRALAG
jgi:trehalose 6-phosphate phosphatase